MTYITTKRVYKSKPHQPSEDKAQLNRANIYEFSLYCKGNNILKHYKDQLINAA
jgi:hypothetical protein